MHNTTPLLHIEPTDTRLTMTAQLESFMKNLVRNDVRATLVVDNAKVLQSSSEHDTQQCSAVGRPLPMGDETALLSPVGRIPSRRTRGGLDVSDHNKRESRWNSSTSASPKSPDRQLGKPTRDVRMYLQPPLCKRSPPSARRSGSLQCPTPFKPNRKSQMPVAA